MELPAASLSRLYSITQGGLLEIARNTRKIIKLFHWWGSFIALAPLSSAAWKASWPPRERQIMARVALMSPSLASSNHKFYPWKFQKTTQKQDGNLMRALASMTHVFVITNSGSGFCSALPSPAKHRIHAKHSCHLARRYVVAELEKWRMLTRWRYGVNTESTQTSNRINSPKSLLFDTARLDLAPPGPEIKTKHPTYPKWHSLWCFSRLCFDFTRRTAPWDGPATQPNVKEWLWLTLDGVPSRGKISTSYMYHLWPHLNKA